MVNWGQVPIDQKWLNGTCPQLTKKEKQMENIGIFDSGIGGVTVLKEIIKVLPNENYIYYSDSKNNPYGDKKQEEILKICDDIVANLLEENCKAIVIACNTASAIASSFLREKYSNLPIIAIEPAYKMVHDYSYDKPTLIMATKGTIDSEKFNLLLKKYNNNKTYILPCVGLADKIEDGNEKEIKQVLKLELEKYRGIVKNVVLGCTHYPLVKEEIKEILGENIEFFDGSPRLALHLKEILKEKNLLNEQLENDKNSDDLKNRIKFIDSNDDLKKEKRFFTILKNFKNK